MRNGFFRRRRSKIGPDDGVCDPRETSSAKPLRSLKKWKCLGKRAQDKNSNDARPKKEPNNNTPLYK